MFLQYNCQFCVQCNVLRCWNCCLYIDWVCDILGFYLILWQEGKIHKCAIPSFFWWCNPGIYRYIKEAMENIAADWWIVSFYFARLVLIKTENGSLKNGKTWNSGSLKNGKHCYIQYIYKIKRHFSRRNLVCRWRQNRDITVCSTTESAICMTRCALSTLQFPSRISWSLMMTWIRETRRTAIIWWDSDIWDSEIRKRQQRHSGTRCSLIWRIWTQGVIWRWRKNRSRKKS